MTRSTWFMICYLGSIGLTHADDLGRLFFTPSERAALDAARAAAAEIPPSTPAITPAEMATVPEPGTTVPIPPPAPVTLNGFVKRSRGPSTVWLNGSTEDARAATMPGDARRAARLHGNAIEFAATREQGALSLKPGQTFAPDEQIVRDAFERVAPPSAP
ncbi:MAG: hypothetical protein HYX63_13160 [Gammaproteobacteria bacterium]|nr:hypothetical protein [Gammaproteobacteria bacterium]